MAAQQDIIGRTVSRVIAWLAVPRPITLPALIGLGAGIGHLLWIYVDSIKMLAWVSGLATPFCMMCATAVWAMRGRLDDMLDKDPMSSSEYKKFVDLNNTHRNKSTFWAAFAAVMALVSSFPAVASQLNGSIWHWMVLASSSAVVASGYAFLLANYWENQIRAYVSKQKLEYKTQAERLALLKTATTAQQSIVMGTGWVDGPELKLPPNRH